MAGSIKGIIVEIGGDTSGLQKSLSKVNSATSSLSKELRGINSLLKLDPSNTTLVAQKQEVLSKNIKTTSQKLEELKKAQELADETIKNGGEISQENYRNLQREIINTQNKLNNLKAEASNWTKAGRSIEEFGNKITNISNKIDKMGTTLTTRLTLPITAVGTYAVKSFQEVDDGADIVIKKTGAVGNSAKELEKVYKQVSSNVAGDFSDIGSAVGEINTRFGFTGDVLEEASEKFMKFAKINDTDVNTAVQKVSRYMGDASIESSKYSEVLDQLSSVAQASGISIDSLAEMLTKYGAPMRALGLETEECIAIFAGWEKAGVNTEIAFSGMKKAIGTWGKEGKNSTEEFKKTLEEIKKCPNIASATTKAIEVFGQKAGPDLADAIKGGRFEYTDFLDIIKKSKGTLENTYEGIIDEADKAQISMKKLKVQFSEVGQEVLTTLEPSLEKILNSTSDLISNYNKLDDKQKKQIKDIILFTASIGPAIKILGTFGKTTGSTITTLGNLSKAIANVKNGVKTAEGQVGTFTTILTKMTSPIGLATISITALTAAVIYFSTKQTEAQKEAKEFASEMANSRKEMENQRNEIDKNTYSNVAHIESVKDLRKELSQLVDENGKVKDGYKGRVEFILNELNNALGTEYKLNGDIIGSYKDLQNEIDETIEKKKAQIILQGEEEKYKDAIENQKQAVEDLKQAEEKLGMSYETAKKRCDDYNNAREKLYGSRQGEELTEGEHDAYWNYTKKEIKSLENLVSGYEDAESKVKTYTDTVNKYADLYAKYTEGKYEEIANTITVTTEDWTSKTLNELNSSITEQSKSLDIYKDIYERTGSEVAKQNAEQAQKNLDALASELSERTKTLGTLGQSEIDAWKNIATQSYGSYSMEISKMSPEMQQKIQEATGIIAAGTPQMQEKAEELGRKTVEEFDKSADAKTKALNTVTGYLNGLDDNTKKELLKQAGIENVDLVLDELNRGDLSEENGRNILEGLWKGLKNNTWQGKILGAASGLAQAVNKAFTGKDGWDEHSPSKKMKKFAEYYIQPISDVMKKKQRAITSTAQQLANEVNSVFNQQSKIPNNFENLQGNLSNRIINDTKTIFTTPQITFNVQELDESKLQQCFNYVNKKFGTQY